MNECRIVSGTTIFNQSFSASLLRQTLPAAMPVPNAGWLVVEFWFAGCDTGRTQIWDVSAHFSLPKVGHGTMVNAKSSCSAKNSNVDWNEFSGCADLVVVVRPKPWDRHLACHRNCRIRQSIGTWEGSPCEDRLRKRMRCQRMRCLTGKMPIPRALGANINEKRR